ncbi:alpha/beta fold hydrolase [Streptomyces sp. NBC_00572]|uniref:alpha/beta fold hydrolase n=1 Tax=Streptomyces sp. NBC_00572 TaxID=2903664 RepID=UPI002255D8AE|nr:alpha/beta hydrolase [Streptomyces sp. NBC_00572]MCX4986601.1 alpha/beta hydrolase [Streptomyces sp. NBC_00572]
MLASWRVPHERLTFEAHGADTHVVVAEGSGPTVVVVPGTNFNAATVLPLATALARRYRTVLADVPGQPGLSSDERGLAEGRLDWYGSWLSEVVEKCAAGPGPVIVLGHSFGAAIALSSASPRIDGQVLVSPGGLTRLRLTPGVLGASAAWLALPRPRHSARLLRTMYAGSGTPRPELVDWMTLVARHARSSGAPGLATVPDRRVPRRVVTGEHDVFLPPRRLEDAVRRRLGVELGIVEGAGHLVIEEEPDLLADLVGRVTR